jgi:hypothetical protein
MEMPLLFGQKRLTENDPLCARSSKSRNCAENNNLIELHRYFQRVMQNLLKKGLFSDGKQRQLIM